MRMLSGRHPKLVSPRGSEVADSDLKFKGAPSDDCDPFAIQNYIDRLAAELYDTLHAPEVEEIGGKEKDEWELMKEKARGVPFQEVTLSIALKHGLMEEVKKENANKSFEKDSILAIMKVREEFLRDYPAASNFEYQWQIWVEWERYLKQIGVTIPQWGKIARKLIRLGVQRIQEDMTKKYSQISGNHKRKSEDLGSVGAQTCAERKRRVSMPPAVEVGSYPGAAVFSTFMHHTLLDTHNAGIAYSSSLNSIAPSPIAISPMPSPSSFSSPPFSPASKQSTPCSSPHSTFGASLYTMIASGSLFSSPVPNVVSPPSSSNPSPVICFDTVPYPQETLQSHPYASGGNTLLPYPYADSGFITSSTSLPTISHYPPHIMMPSASPMTSPHPSPHPSPLPSPSYASSLQYSPPSSPSSPSSVSSSPRMYSSPVAMSISPAAYNPLGALLEGGQMYSPQLN